jgi:hypothetical protein
VRASPASKKDVVAKDQRNVAATQISVGDAQTRSDTPRPLRLAPLPPRPALSEFGQK